MLSSSWIIISLLLTTGSLTNGSKSEYHGNRKSSTDMKAIHRKLAAENPAWNRIVTFILQSKRIVQQQEKQSGDKADRGREWVPYGECCLTEGSGQWCRRHPIDAGDYREAFGDGNNNLATDQLGHRLNASIGELYEATDWGRSCRSLADPISMGRKHQLDLPVVFSILVNFGLNEYYHFLVSLLNYLEESAVHGCGEGFVWDPFASACRQIFCRAESYESVLIRDHCPETTPNQTYPDWRMLYVIEMDVIQLTLYADAVYENGTEINDAELLQLIENSFIPAFSAFVKIDPQRITDLSVSLINSSSTFVRSMAIDFHLFQAPEGSEEPTIDSVVALIGSLVLQDDLFVIVGNVPVQLIGLHEQPTESETDRFADWCRGGNIVTYINDQFVIDVVNKTDTNQTEFIVFIKETGEWYESGEYMADLFFYGDSAAGVSLSGSVMTCQNKSVLLDQKCTVIRLNQSEFIYVESNQTVIYTGHIPFIDPVLTHGEYESFPNGDLAVCLEVQNEFPLVLLIESYLGISLTSISIIAMSCTVLTYVLFAELRNLPGLAVLNLCVSNILFDLTFLASSAIRMPRDDSLCLVAAILAHYEGLAAYFWTNVMAADLYLTLGRWSAAPRSPSKMLPRYMLYAYGLPLVIVSISITIQFCGCTGEFTIDYGLLICWINNPLANLIFFGLPLALALLANIVLFVMTIIVVHKSTSCPSCTPFEKAMCQLKLYARMATVMGFTWIFALISACFDASTMPGVMFTYVYIVFNASGGIFVFFAFTCNKRVWQLYKQMFNGSLGRTDSNRTTAGQPSVAHQERKQTGRPLKTVSIETLVSNSSSSSSSSSTSSSNSSRSSKSFDSTDLALAGIQNSFVVQSVREATEDCST